MIPLVAQLELIKVVWRHAMLVYFLVDLLVHTMLLDAY